MACDQSSSRLPDSASNNPIMLHSSNHCMSQSDSPPNCLELHKLSRGLTCDAPWPPSRMPSLSNLERLLSALNPSSPWRASALPGEFRPSQYANLAACLTHRAFAIFPYRARTMAPLTEPGLAGLVHIERNQLLPREWYPIFASLRSLSKTTPHPFGKDIAAEHQSQRCS
jgi:hypothetical protein